MKSDKTLTCIGLWVLIIVGIVGGVLMNGWALKVLWAWFIVPIFAFPKLTILQAYGFMLVFSVLSGRRGSKSTSAEREDKEIWEIVSEILSHTILVPLLLVGIGWIIRLFM